MPTQPITAKPVPGSPGTQTASVGATQVGLNMHVERVYLFSTSTQPAVARLYVGDPANPLNTIDLTLNGVEDSADTSSPILVPGGSSFTIVWTGLSATDSAGNPTVCGARVQWREDQVS